MKTFKNITIEDYKILKSYVSKSKQKACDYTVANLVLWGEVYDTQYCIIEDCLILKSVSEGEVQFAFPMGDGNIAKALEWMEAYCQEEEIPFIMSKVESQMFEQLQGSSPYRYEIIYDRDSFDYIYKTEDLKNLSGKKYHGKKNHINKFKKEHPEWSYESITEANKEECIEMVKQWCIENGCFDDEEKIAEVCLVIKAIKNMEYLELKGGAIRTKEGIVAITLGEEVDDTTFDIHFEKAFASVQGAYPIINQQFIEHELTEYTYVNREEDLGVEGLRKAKESYHPELLLQKGIVKVRAAVLESYCEVVQ